MQLTNDQIKKILPHRDPLLLVDSVSELNIGQNIHSLVYLNPDWEIFKGHFPKHPVLPGIYLIEACAQTCAILLLAKDSLKGQLPLLFAVQNLRFLRQAIPGDRLSISANLETAAGEGMYEFKVTVTKGQERIAHGKLTIALRPGQD